MKDLIDKILKYLPQYFMDFGSAFSGPKQFIAQKRVDADEAFGDAVLFIGVSAALVVLMTAPLQPVEKDIGTRVGGTAVTFLITIPLAAMAVRIAWWMVGGRAPTRLFIITYAYFFGVMVVSLAAISLLTMGFLKSFDPQAYEKIIQAAQKGNELPDLTESYIPAIAFGIYGIGYLVMTIWMVVGWGAYRQLNHLGKVRSFFAFVLTGMLTIPVVAVVYFVGRAVS